MDRRGPLLILLAALLWGTTGTAQALAPAEAQPLVVGALRLLIGGAVLMGGLCLREGGLHIPRADFPVLLLAAACMALYQVCFFAAVRLTGVAVGTVVGIGSAPLLAGLLGWLLYRARPGRAWAAATSLALAGCALLALSGAHIHVNAWGMLLALGAGAAYALFTLLSQRMLVSTAVLPVMAGVFGLGGLLLTPLWVGMALRGQSLAWVFSLRGAAALLHLGLVTTALAYLLFGAGLRRVPAAHAVTLSLAEPLTAALLGTLLLREPLSLPGGLGILLIFAGLVVVGKRA